ncbi:hypothetical protein B0H21DRAFT_779517 [Amylocystis lapponica]|nr:hypothetical protein B0H21DRAFT_779517 [Amylocystis lapponica]
MRPDLYFLLILFVFSTSTSTRAGNTTCLSNSLDWYTDAVGETPCTTYQRLRQICNSEYQVGSFRPNTPGDNCDDQVSDCCCNSIAFALSMMCMKYGAIRTMLIPYIPSGVGAYQMYTSQGSACTNPVNQTLPTDVQAAVCNQDIRIIDTFYGIFWDNGACTYTRESAETNMAAHPNDTYTHCANEILPSTQPTSARPSATSSQALSVSPANQVTNVASIVFASQSALESPTPHASHTGAIAGGVAGGILGLVTLLLLGLYGLRNRRERVQSINPDVTPYAEWARDPRPLRQESQESQSPTQTVAQYSDYNTHYAVSFDSDTVVSTAATDMPLREEDGGPAVEFVRSLSGRLPPAYSQLLRGVDQPGEHPGYI